MGVRLNTRQQKFAEIVATEEVTDVEAYMRAGYSEKNAYNNAHKLRKNMEISKKITEIRDRILDDAILTAQERRKILSDMAKDEEVKSLDIRGAIDILNKMDGSYIEKRELHVTGQLVIGLPQKRLDA